MRRRQIAALSAAVLLTPVLAGCGASKGSDTACSDFRNMSLGDQKTVVSNALKDHNQSTSPLEIDAGVLSAKGYCFVHSGSDKVGGIFGGS
jgi:hypothetical protein